MTIKDINEETLDLMYSFAQTFIKLCIEREAMQNEIKSQNKIIQLLTQRLEPKDKEE